MSTSRLFFSIVVGIVIWYMAALFIRYFGDRFFTVDSGHLIGLYIATPLFPLAWLIAERVRGRNMSTLYDSIVILSVTGAVLDAIAFPFFAPMIYHQPREILAMAGAWLLWAVGTTIFLAYGFKMTAKTTNTNINL